MVGGGIAEPEGVLLMQGRVLDLVLVTGDGFLRNSGRFLDEEEYLLWFW